MSKQSEAKKKQNYNPKPEPSCCSNCVNFTSKIEKFRAWDGSMQGKETNLRCIIGGFKVAKRGTCSEFTPIQP